MLIAAAATASMSKSPSPDPPAASDPFNHYNTEFVKLDAHDWQEESGSLDANASQFSMSAPEDQSSQSIDESNVAPDSINVITHSQLNHEHLIEKPKN